MNGILCMNKPEGFTSFDVVAKLRGILHIRRLGHAGTLDPMATGVLPVFVGRATRACDCLPIQDKSYLAQFRLGLTTDTQDITGKTLSESGRAISRAELEAVLLRFSGEIMQIPPMYSAVSVDGKRLYDLARQGIEVERPARQICIEQLELRDYDEATRSGTLFVACSKGTYVRTLLHDIGAALGCGGILTGLVRESACGFGLCDCVGFAEVERARDENRLESLILPIETAFSTLPQIRLDAEQTVKYRNGMKLLLSRLSGATEAERCAV